MGNAINTIREYSNPFSSNNISNNDESQKFASAYQTIIETFLVETSNSLNPYYGEVDILAAK